jgi:hypothetical protein
MTDADRLLRLLTNAGATQKDIAKACDMEVRDVQQAILELRLAGHPIISTADRRGMRLAQTADEARACADALRRRAIRQLLTARALRRTARRMQEEEDARARVTLWDFFKAYNPSDTSRSA